MPYLIEFIDLKGWLKVVANWLHFELRGKRQRRFGGKNM
jgi:hypothetical protein